MNKKYFFGPNSPAGRQGQEKVLFNLYAAQGIVESFTQFYADETTDSVLNTWRSL